MCRTTVGRVLAVEGRTSSSISTASAAARRLLVPDLAPGDLVLVGLGTVLGRVTAADLDALRALQAGRPTPAQRPPTSASQGAP